MNANLIFNNVKVYNVQDRIDIIVGVDFQIEILETLPPDFDIFTNKDPVLVLSDDGRSVQAAKLGQSLLRFMSGPTVIKDIAVHVVEATTPAATALNLSLGQPLPK